MRRPPGKASSLEARAWTGARALGAALLTTALALTLLPAPGGASELEEGELVEEGVDDAIRDSGRRLDTGAVTTNEIEASFALWTWPEGRRGYRLGGATSNADGYTQVYAVDLDTGKPVAPSQDLSPTAWVSTYSSSDGYSYGRGQPYTATVDRAAGRLFVAYQTQVGSEDFNPQDITGAVTQQDPDRLMRVLGVNLVDDPCARGNSARDRARCLGGFHVLDGETLEQVGRLPLRRFTVDGAVVAPIPRALRYVEGADGAGKLLVVVEDVHANLADSGGAMGLATQSGLAAPRRHVQAVHYLVQVDVDSGDTEWALRLEACRGIREPPAPSTTHSGRQHRYPHPAAVFLGGDGAAWVGCHGANRTGTVVRVPLGADGRPGVVEADGPDAGPGEGSGGGGLFLFDEGGGDAVALRQAAQVESWAGPAPVQQILVDPGSLRVLMKVNDNGEAWWVFDGPQRGYIGTIGIGPYDHRATMAVVDEDRGRLYVQAPARSGFSGGLMVTDIRRTPIAQALVFPQFTELTNVDGINSNTGLAIPPLAFAAGVDGRPSEVYLPSSSHGSAHRVLEDLLPVGVDVDDDRERRTLDLDEAEGVTAASFDGAARGFGARVTLVGGAEGAARAGPADPVGDVRGTQQREGQSAGGVSPDDPLPLGRTYDRLVPLPDDCMDLDREFVLAYTGPDQHAVVDDSGARGGTQPVVADSTSRADFDRPVARCADREWEELWRGLMVGGAPVSEPSVPWMFGESQVFCTGEEPDDRWGDPVAGMFSAQVNCSEDQAGGWSQARGVSVEGVSVSEAFSSFRIWRDPQRGIVSRVESVVRGVSIDGLVRIDTVRGVAESWANGRQAGGVHDPDLERRLGLTGSGDDGEAQEEGDEDGSGEGGEPVEGNPYNCDRSRPAGTCFERHLFGVSVGDGQGGTAFSCGPCGDEAALVDGLGRALAPLGMSARLRDPDAGLARGAADGYQAAVQKPREERFSDLVLNADLLQTVVPALEIIRSTDEGRQRVAGPGDSEIYGPPHGARGRQIIQLAGVDVSSTYSIQCLLVYDAVTNVCAEPAEPPASLTVELVDGEGAPLAGGAFELRRDTDGDGVLGLVDELVEDGACATGPEGLCSFAGLEPGSYLVSQTAAPEGYAPVDEPLAVSLLPGDDLTVTFTNVPNVSTISLTVTDLDGAPVEGAVFGVFPEDGDGLVADGAEPVATCTTDADGVCSVTVPPDAYVLRQLSAPDGLLPIDDIAFVISQAGQTADVALTLGAAGTDPAPVTEPAAGPVEDFASAPAPLAQPAVSITPAPARSAPSVGATTPAIAEPPPAIAEQVGGTVIRVIRAPAGALRLAARSPVEAASLVMVLLLVGLAVMAVARRHQLARLIAAPHDPEETDRATGPRRRYRAAGR